MLLHTHFTPTNHKPFQFSKAHPPCPFFGFPARFQLFHAFFSTGSGFLSRDLLAGPGYSVWILTFHFTYLQHQHGSHAIIYMNLNTNTMLYAIKYYEPTSYRNLVIDVLSAQHQALSMQVPERTYWNRFDTDYLDHMMAALSNAIKH